MNAVLKMFFSHVCHEASHPFLDWISERIRKDLQQFEPFIACKSRDWNDSKELNAHLDESLFFIPVISAEFPDRPNCTAELGRARGLKDSNGAFPVIFPIKFGCGPETMDRLNFSIDQKASKGERWIDFSASEDWEARYEEFRERVLNVALEKKLLGDEDFYRDCRHLDLILNNDKPTPFEIESAIKLCRRGTEYGNYFFKRLDQKRWIHYLKTYGFFRGNPPPIESPQHPGFYSLPHWPVLDYLEKISKDCATAENREYAVELMQIIREVTRPKEGSKADNSRTWWYFAKILASLPTEVIKVEDIELVADWVDSKFSTTLVASEIGKSLLPKLLRSPNQEDWEKAAKLIEIVTRIHWVERKYSESDIEREQRAAIDTYWLRELFKRNACPLGEKCGKKAMETLKNRLTEVLRPDRDDLYSYIWRRAIEDHAQNYEKDEIRDVLVSALRDILSAYCKEKGTEAKEALRKLLTGSLDILKRIALHVVKEQYATFGDLFWEILKPEIFSSNLRHELFELLATHFADFSPEQQDQVLEIIAQLSTDSDDESTKSQADAYLRLGWLKAIIARGNEQADRLYEECRTLAQYEPEHPEFGSWGETGPVGGKAPCSADELLSKSIPEIVNYLKEFKETDWWTGPTENGLREVLKEAFHKKPNKFECHLDDFLVAPLPYQCAIVRSFQELWSAKKVFDWSKVLGFCLAIVEPEDFWRKSDDPQQARSSITSAISDLIKVGVSNDEWAFEESHLAVAKKILTRILEKQPSTAKAREGDAYAEAINTPKGNCLEALFGYSLRQARLCDKRGEDRSPCWEDIQPVFDRELDQCKEGNFEFSALMGRYLPNLFYLSKVWATKNINHIFSDEYETNWRCAMDGYAYVNIINDEIYSLLKTHGHFKKALQDDFRNRQVRKKIIQNIAVGYLRKFEDLKNDGSLFKKLFQDWRQDDILEIISLFWTLRDVEIKEETRDLVLDFWKRCYEKIRGQEESNALILSELNLLTAFLKEISDEHKDWLLQSAPHVDERYHSPFLLEYLYALVDQSPEAVADVYLKMLTRTTPTYDEKNVRAIVETLYQKGLRDKANQICGAYARANQPDLLRDLYNHYNS